jgi:hypothetical protein
MYKQKLVYIHYNSLKTGFAEEPWHWLDKHATAYFTNKKWLPDIIILDGVNA